MIYPAVSGCALCGAQPSMDVRRSAPSWRGHSGYWFRFVCRAVDCVGHKGQWKAYAGTAMRAWNSSQHAKMSTIRLHYVTEALHRAHDRQAQEAER